MKNLHTYHLGYRLGFIGNPRGFARDAAVEYQDEGVIKKSYIPYLRGWWLVGSEELEYKGAPREGYIEISLGGEECTLVGDHEKFEIVRKGDAVRFVPTAREVKARELTISGEAAVPLSTP